MWDDHRLLDRLSAWLVLLAVLAVGVVTVRALTDRLFPIREVTVLGARQAATQRALGPLIHALKGGFFTLDLDEARQALERLPWVRRAAVRRLWPDRLLIEISEHVPAAAWNGRQVLSVHGELFAVRPWEALPRIHAPEGMQRQVAMRLGEFQRLLGPAGWRLTSLQVSPRGAWRLAIEPATAARAQALAAVGDAPRVRLELGRERLTERLMRFLSFYDAAVSRLGPMTQIDLRYPNGFTARRPGTADSERKNRLSGLSHRSSPATRFQTPVIRYA